MSDKPVLLEKHRQAWTKLIGQRITFRATVAQFGHKHRQGTQIKRGATLVIVDVHRKNSHQVIDHVWLEYGPELAKFGEYIRPNATIEFSAIVRLYEKGKNHYDPTIGNIYINYQDIELTAIKAVKLIKVPYLPKKYQPLVDDELISFAIATHLNTKTGTKLGQDPRGYLGNIYIGQGFCNRFARHLSWRWLNELPNKYRYQREVNA